MSADCLAAGWTLVKLGDVAVNSTAFSSSPIDDGYERYVLGKDIPDGGAIETWGEVGDGHFGSRIRTRIEAGDVICTTRGPNLRVARATFRALGAHTNFVLRSANEDVLLQDFLALVAESEGFQAHLARNFRGSVNLFVNWSDAARYEFALPPLEEQHRIAEMLSAVDKAINARLLVRARLEPLKRTVFSAALRGGTEQALAWGPVASSVKVQCLGELCTVTRGASPRPKGNPAYFARGRTAHHWIMISDVTRSKVGKVLTDTAEFLTDEGVAKSRKVSPGSLLLTNCATVGVPVFSGVHGCIHDGFLLFEDLSPELNLDYLYRLFEFLTPWFRSSAQTGTQANLNTEILRRLEVPVLPLAAQAEIVSRLDGIDETSVSVDVSLDNLKGLRSALLESLLAGVSDVH